MLIACTNCRANVEVGPQLTQRPEVFLITCPKCQYDLRVRAEWRLVSVRVEHAQPSAKKVIAGMLCFQCGENATQFVNGVYVCEEHAPKTRR